MEIRLYIKQDSLLLHSEMSRLVGFAGYQGSGKDTCADALTSNGFVKYAFADPVKRFCKIIFDLTDEQLWGGTKNVVDDRFGRTPRELLQMFGTDFVRNMVCESFWIDKFARWYLERDCDVVVSDVRFQDEVAIIQQLGGKVFRIDRPNVLKKDTHVSERSDDLVVDGVITNDGTLTDLTAKVESRIQDFLRDR